MGGGWTRHGTCDPAACGAWCCRFIGQTSHVIANPAGLTSDLAYLRVQGYRFEVRDGKVIRATLPGVQSFHPCPAHDATTLRCTIYADRPETCRAFPTEPEQIAGTGCTYTFTKEGA